MKQRWNILIYFGFFLTLVAFLSYFTFFVRFPATRDVPWVNLLLFACSLAMLGVGLSRAYRRPEQYRGRVSGAIFGALSVLVFALFIFYNFWFSRQLPSAANAPAVGEKAPDFTLPDSNGNPVALSGLWSGGAGGGNRDQWVLLVFYRGYW